MDFKILNLADLEKLSKIFGEAQHALFNPSQSDHNAWAQDMAARHLARGTTFWSGFIDRQTVGFVGLLLDKQPNGKNREFADLTHVGVRRDLRGKGYGSALLKHVESEAVSRGVRVLEVQTNTDTMSFYEKSGYVVNAKHRFGWIVHMGKDLRQARVLG